MRESLDYFKKLGKPEKDYVSKIEEVINLGEKAKKTGFDPTSFVESKFITSSYERISTIVGLKGIDKRLKELMKEIKDPYNLAYQIAEDVVLGRFTFLDNETSLLVAAKTAIAVLTKGMRYHYITSIKKIKLHKNGDATTYPAIILSENSRLAPRLLIFLIVVLDKLRKPLGIDRWKIETLPRKHVLAIVRDFYIQTKEGKVPLDEVIGILRKMPVEVIEEKNNTKVQISKHFSKLIINLPKYSSFLKKLRSSLNLEGWEWVDKLLSIKKIERSNTILVSSNALGGFRLIPNPDLPKNTVGLHPAIHILLNGKITYGTKLYIDNKGPYGVTFLENILPPIVKLKDGTVKMFTGGREDREQIKEILFFGDLALSSVKSDVYTESRWLKDLYKASKDDLSKVLKAEITFPIAKEISEKYRIPLYPPYTFFLQLLSVSEILTLREMIKSFLTEEIPQLIFRGSAKSLLEKALVPFKIIGEEIYIEGDNALALYHLLRPDKELKEIPAPLSSLELLSHLSGLQIPNRLSSFASLSFKIKMEQETKKVEKPHSIFPLGDYYHVSTDILDHETIYIELANLYCDHCSIFTLSRRCPKCGTLTKLMYFCEYCRKVTTQEKCEICGLRTKPNYLKGINITEEINQQSELIGLKPLKPLIGIEELKSSIKIPEPLSKGIVRQYHALTVDRDATIKFSTYLCHANILKVSDLNISLEKIKQMGYETDIFGEELTSGNQYIQLKPYDIIISREMAKLFLKITKYLDELLVRLYKMEEFYNIEVPEDLLGHLVLVVPEGTNTGIILRIIGFTNDDASYAHPLISKMFNINYGFQKGEFTLLVDTLLNFSRYYIEEESDGFPFFIQPVLKTHVESKTLHVTHINLKRGPIDKNSFKDAYEALQFQLQLIKEANIFSKKEVFYQIMRDIVVKNLLNFVANATTGKFICSGCNLLLRRIPLSRKCPACRREVKSLFSPSTFSKPLYTLKSFLDQIEDQETKEKLMLAIENIDMLTRVKKQATIADFF